MSLDTTLEVKSELVSKEEALSKDAGMAEENTFDRLYERYSSYVYNTCMGILGNRDDARDAMQDTFVQLYRHLPTFRGDCTHATWLYRVAVNKCMDILRRRRRFESSESMEEYAAEDEPESDGILEQRVRQTILKLKPDHRAVLVLYHFQQLSYNEIAESLGCSLDQVRIRLHRARKAFRSLYDDGGDEDEV